MTAKLSQGAKKIPPLGRHKATDQAYVRLDGEFIYLGKWDDPKTQENYQQTIAEWLLGHSRATDPDTLTTAELMDRYVQYAAGYYLQPDGRTNREYANICICLRPLRRLYGSSLAREFGPLALRVVRDQMIGMTWCRSNVNHNVGRIKRMFRWATENELVPGTVFHALQAVSGLKRGRSGARETSPIKPVPNELVDAVLPYVSRQVWAMICLQRLTGARGGEICIMRPCDIDRSGSIWVYKPAEHKTAYQGHERLIYLGPKAQEVLSPFLLRSAHEYCFSPAEAMNERRAELSKVRKTPMSCGNRPGSNRKDRAEKFPGNRYMPCSYGRAIEYALRRAFPAPADLAMQEGESYRHWHARLTKAQKLQVQQYRKQHHWHPHQLRHNAATELRKEFGIEAARIILGHRSAAITEVYAEMDQQKAIEAMMKVG